MVGVQMQSMPLPEALPHGHGFAARLWRVLKSVRCQGGQSHDHHSSGPLLVALITLSCPSCRSGFCYRISAFDERSESIAGCVTESGSTHRRDPPLEVVCLGPNLSLRAVQLLSGLGDFARMYI